MPSRKRLFPEKFFKKPKKKFNPIGFLMALDMEKFAVDSWINKNGKKKKRTRNW